MNKPAIIIAALVLTAFGVAGTTLVAFTHTQTSDRIAENERQALLRQLNALVPVESVDNDMITDRVTVSDPEMLGAQETTVYIGRRTGEPVAAVFTTVAPDGYSGPVKLLVAVRRDGTLGGVRVVSHRETPGLGDKIELEKSDWILGFEGRSLGDPPAARWTVRKDGGDFDQFTGATITPRILVTAVKKTLLYFRDHQQVLFAPPKETATTAGVSG
jgi:electron transport complex protein RnfG